MVAASGTLRRQEWEMVLPRRVRIYERHAMTQSRNVREGRYVGFWDGKHCRSHNLHMRCRKLPDKYVFFIHPEMSVQDMLKGEGPYTGQVMKGELGQFGDNFRFISDSKQRGREYAESTQADFAERAKRAMGKIPADTPSVMVGKP